MQIQVVKLRSLVQMLREFRLCGQYLERMHVEIDVRGLENDA